jgi:hypothetical protein
VTVTNSATGEARGSALRWIFPPAIAFHAHSQRSVSTTFIDVADTCMSRPRCFAT